MSRATNFALSEAELRQRCAAAGVAISVIEGLPGGGTRLVCVTMEGAETLRLRHAKDVLHTPQKRNPFFVPALQK